MTTIHFIDHTGADRAVEIAPGTSVMKGALENGVPGIAADCGGVCSCATCHVYVDPAWFDRVGPAQGDEVDLLEMVDDRAATSRLSCQIAVTADLDGLIVRTPERQG